MYPKAIARSKGDETPTVFIWVFEEGTNAPATIAATTPTNRDDARPLQALVAHLDLEEWDEL